MPQSYIKMLEPSNISHLYRTVKEIDELPSPRVIRTHWTIDWMLNPNLLDSTKVFDCQTTSCNTILMVGYK